MKYYLIPLIIFLNLLTGCSDKSRSISLAKKAEKSLLQGDTVKADSLYVEALYKEYVNVKALKQYGALLHAQAETIADEDKQKHLAKVHVYWYSLKSQQLPELKNEVDQTKKLIYSLSEDIYGKKGVIALNFEEYRKKHGSKMPQEQLHTIIKDPSLIGANSKEDYPAFRHVVDSLIDNYLPLYKGSNKANKKLTAIGIATGSEFKLIEVYDSIYAKKVELEKEINELPFMQEEDHFSQKRSSSWQFSLYNTILKRYMEEKVAR